MPNPATGNGKPYSTYCFMKLVICAPARLEIDEIRLGVADLEQVGGEIRGVGGHQLVGDELSRRCLAMKRFATLSRSCPNA